MPTADGRYEVTIEVRAVKSVLENGTEKVMEMDEWLDVGLFSEHPNAARGFGSLIYEVVDILGLVHGINPLSI